MKINFVILLLIATLTILISCSKDSDNNNTGVDCSTVPKSWAANVSPIIMTFCNQSGCHNAGSNNGPGPLTNHAQVAGSASSIRDAVSSGRMPQNASLTTAQKNTIICWIDSGSPNN